MGSANYNLGCPGRRCFSPDCGLDSNSCLGQWRARAVAVELVVVAGGDGGDGGLVFGGVCFVNLGCSCTSNRVVISSSYYDAGDS